MYICTYSCSSVSWNLLQMQWCNKLHTKTLHLLIAFTVRLTNCITRVRYVPSAVTLSLRSNRRWSMLAWSMALPRAAGTGWSPPPRRHPWPGLNLHEHCTNLVHFPPDSYCDAISRSNLQLKNTLIDTFFNLFSQKNKAHWWLKGNQMAQCKNL